MIEYMLGYDSNYVMSMMIMLCLIHEYATSRCMSTHKIKIKIKKDKCNGKQACRCRTDPSKVGLDYGLSWKWIGRPNHSIVARPVRTLM